MTPSEKYFNIIINLIRDYFILFLIAVIISFVLDYRDFFGNSNEIYYIVISFIAIFGVFVTIQKYRNPLQYSPKHVFFVKDRNDSIVKMKPYLDPWIIKLGLINPKEIVNVRYSMYPDLDLGLDLDPNTGIISGYPMEIGNHVSIVTMKYLGGSYSTKVRVEAVDTLKEKMIHQRDEFAPPRTVAQLLIREEDLLKREQDLDYDMSKRQEILEDEYRSKEMGLKELISIEKEKFNKQLSTIKRDYQSQLSQKDSKISDLNKEMEDKLKELEDESNVKIDKLEAEMSEALQDKEREFVEFEKESKQRLEEKKKELEESYKVEEEPEEEAVEEEPEEEPEEEAVEEEPEEEPEEEVVEEGPEEEPEEEEVEEEPEEEEYDYVSMTKAELVELAKKRGLAFSGTKKKLISRLEDND